MFVCVFVCEFGGRNEQRASGLFVQNIIISSSLNGLLTPRLRLYACEGVFMCAYMQISICYASHMHAHSIMLNLLIYEYMRDATKCTVQLSIPNRYRVLIFNRAVFPSNPTLGQQIVKLLTTNRNFQTTLRVVQHSTVEPVGHHVTISYEFHWS